MADLLENLRSENEPDRLLRLTLEFFGAETGTIHTLEADGLLHLRALAGNIPAPVL